MTASELARQVQESRTLSREAFEERVREEAAWLTEQLRDGAFDKPQAIVGLEYELYAVDQETGALKRVPRRLLELIGFEQELGLHNAEMHTSPQPLNRFGLACQETEVQSRIAAAQEECHTEGIHLVSDGFWTIPPTGESARTYLDDYVESDGTRIAVNMSKSVRYHRMTNSEEPPLGLRVDTPHVTIEAETPAVESLTTSIQPHYQVPRASNLPAYFRYALRVAGPVLALGVNSPFFPPEFYDAPAEDVLADGWMENRIPTFEGMLNPAGDRPAKVRFPEDVSTVGNAVDAIADDPPVVPTEVEKSARFDDAFRHLSHKHGSFWRWVRPVFEGATPSEANARVEFRPLPAQPTIRDSVGFLALFAGLLEGLYARDHPVARLDWAVAKENFYAAMRDGLSADMTWIDREGEQTTDTDVIYEDLFAFAREGLVGRGLPAVTADEYLRPLRARVEREMTPARWKHEQVRQRAAAGASLEEAITGMQSLYIRQQRETLLTGSFLDWIDDTPRVQPVSRDR